MSGCYTSPSNTFPYIPLQSTSQTVHNNVVGDNQMVTFTSDKQNRLADTKQREREGNIQIYEKKKPSRTAIPTNNTAPFHHVSI
jgi:hypothetical protein